MYGVYGLFSELLDEEIRGMKTLFDTKDLEVLLSVAMMRFAQEAALKRAVLQKKSLQKFKVSKRNCRNKLLKRETNESSTKN